MADILSFGLGDYIAAALRGDLSHWEHDGDTANMSLPLEHSEDIADRQKYVYLFRGLEYDYPQLTKEFYNE